MRDDLERRLDDVEKRVARLEGLTAPMPREEALEAPIMAVASGQFCLCGREVCRAPACPTFQPDPLGR